MESAIRVQILGLAVGILFSTNALKKGMNPSILSPAIGKIAGQTVFFILD